MSNSTVETPASAAYNYDHEKVSSLFSKLIRKQLAPEIWNWLEERANLKDLKSFYSTFAALPRKTGKQVVQVTAEDDQLLRSCIPGTGLKDWTLDRLARVWLLMQMDISDKERYFQAIENLFLTGEMNELVALYSSLPFLAYPQMWVKRCAEGIRSNIANVLEAIMYENPYPANYLTEPAWNQLVLKAFFTEKSINRITGLASRSNTELAHIVSDYAHERWAAGRKVNPLLWRCVGPHIDERLFQDISRVMLYGDSIEKEAAVLACSESRFPEALALLNARAEMKASIENGSLNWETVAEKQS